MLGSGRETGIRAVLFDFDDTLQNRPAAFKKYTDFFLEKYFPALSAEQKEQRAEKMLQRNNGGYVAYLEYFPPCLNRGNGTTPRRPRTSTGSFSFAFPSTPRFFRCGACIEGAAPSWIPAGNHHQRPFRTAEPQAGCIRCTPYMDIAVVSGMSRCTSRIRKFSAARRPGWGFPAPAVYMWGTIPSTCPGHPFAG